MCVPWLRDVLAYVQIGTPYYLPPAMCVFAQYA